jgi:predicted Holliday junction resolvase-like endonuclease
MTGAVDLVLLLGLLAAVAVLAFAIVTILLLGERRRSHARMEQLLADHSRELTDARRDSVQRSRSSLKGQIAEQMAPLLPGFRYLPADARFLGDPIDYVVFNGYSALRDAGGDAAEMEIVLLEVKQGGSALTSFQKGIALSVEKGRVRFEILRIAADGSLETQVWRPRQARDRG